MSHETFTVEHDQLIRSVIPDRGKPYEHSCDLETYKLTLHEIDDLNGRLFIYEDVVELTNLPASRIATAIAFLKERSIIVPALSRRHKASSDHIFLDGMCEWSALAQPETGTT